jgi:hypothetical protein
LSYLFLKFPRPHISEKLEIFYTVGLDTIGMILAFFGQLAPHLLSVDYVGSEPALSSIPPDFSGTEVRKHARDRPQRAQRFSQFAKKGRELYLS